MKPQVIITYNWTTPIKIELSNGVVLYEVDMSPKPYWEVCWAHGWGGEYPTEEEAIEDCVNTCGHTRSTREIKPEDEEYEDPRILRITQQTFVVDLGTPDYWVRRNMKITDFEGQIVSVAKTREELTGRTDITEDIPLFAGDPQ
jgi:hypothetical protein